MENNEKIVEVLNDLIQINNDRAAGFEKAAKDLDDANIDLKAGFDAMASDSHKYSIEIAELVGKRDGEADTTTSVSGTLHRAWIDIKAAFGGDGRHSILAECERGEDAIKKAYKDALAENVFNEETTSVLTKQQAAIKVSHDAVKALRDAAE